METGRKEVAEGLRVVEAGRKEVAQRGRELQAQRESARAELAEAKRRETETLRKLDAETEARRRLERTREARPRRGEFHSDRRGGEVEESRRRSFNSEMELRRSSTSIIFIFLCCVGSFDASEVRIQRAERFPLIILSVGYYCIYCQINMWLFYM